MYGTLSLAVRLFIKIARLQLRSILKFIICLARMITGAVTACFESTFVSTVVQRASGGLERGGWSWKAAEMQNLIKAIRCVHTFRVKIIAIIKCCSSLALMSSSCVNSYLHIFVKVCCSKRDWTQTFVHAILAGRATLQIY